MNCPQCSAPIVPGSAFCDECGVDVRSMAAPQPAAPSYTPAAGATCPSCTAPVTPGEAYCDNCGAALSQAPVPPAPRTGTQVMSQQQPAAPAGAGTVTCPQCQTQLPAGSAFCDNCGANLGAAAPPLAQQPTYQPQPMQQPTYQPQPMQQPTYQPSVAPTPARLVVQNSNVTLPFPQGQAEIVVGREDPVSSHFPEVDMTDHGGDEGGVSRKHARFLFQNGQWHLEDLNSVNGTWVNPRTTRQKLQQGQPWPLNSGDEVRFGRVVLTFYQ